MTPKPSPDQLQWVLDHNMQIRGGHRAQIAYAVDVWRADQAELVALRAQVQTLSAALADVQGALMDAGTVPVPEAAGLGQAVRTLVAQAAALRAAAQPKS